MCFSKPVQFFVIQTFLFTLVPFALLSVSLFPFYFLYVLLLISIVEILVSMGVKRKSIPSINVLSSEQEGGEINCSP